MNEVWILAVFNAVAFFYYGLTCLFSSRMMREFIRFGLSPKQRLLTGILQLFGATGVLIGLLTPILGMLSTAGLTLMMFMGFGVRLKIRNSIKQSVPSFTFMLLNAYLFYSFYTM
jgi:uncharacterized membrane protein YphA (DoxX/SURF4 family)